MDRQAVLAAYDRQIRQNPAPEHADGTVERDQHTVRVISPGDWTLLGQAIPGGPEPHQNPKSDKVQYWSGVTWCDPGDDDVDAIIAAQVRAFAGLEHPWEWKHYSYDRPADLPERLRAAGFTAEPPETLLVAEIADLDLAVSPPDGVRLERIVDQAGVDALVRVHNEAFGGNHLELGKAVLERLGTQPDSLAAVLAVGPDGPVCGGRVEFHAGTEFASLWGGGTVPGWRGRGVFRAVVAYRAALAAAAGFRYLQVDASPASRPILRRLGFVELATTTPFVHPGSGT